MDKRYEYCVLPTGFTSLIASFTEDQAEGVSRLMPRATHLRRVRHLPGFVLLQPLQDTGDLERVGEVRGGEPPAEEFREGAACRGGGEVVVDV